MSHRSFDLGITPDVLEKLISKNGPAFVEQAYKTILRRFPDPEGMDTYLNHLAQGMTKEEVIFSLSESEEGQSKKGVLFFDFHNGYSEINTDFSSIGTDEKNDLLEINIEGYVDVLTNEFASGWVWSPDFPEKLLTVEVWLYDEIIAVALANHPRTDLVNFGKGTGNYGFVVNFKLPIEYNSRPKFIIRHTGGKSLFCPEVRHSDEPKNRLSSDGYNEKNNGIKPKVEAFLDNFTLEYATGWAWIPEHPEQCVVIEALAGEVMVGRTAANQFRQDLLDFGRGHGAYGFTLSFSERFNPKELRLAIVTDTNANLSIAMDVTERLFKEYQNSKPIPTASDLIREQEIFTNAGPFFEEHIPNAIGKISQEYILSAFYLPQFHPIEENNKFWGTGFTEWRQLARGLSRFPGHYQPRIPRDLGFYSLLDEGVYAKQVELARSSGINAFAFYYYYFDRKRVLDRPIEMMLRSSVSMPFYLIWANENWTRTWDGAENSILLQQTYNPENEDNLLSDLARHFEDDRYLRLGGRPFFVIYNPRHIPDACETISRWRDKFRNKYNFDPIIFMAQTFGSRDPAVFGLDGAIEFPPHKLSDNLPGRVVDDAYSKNFSGRVIDYDSFIEASLNDVDSIYPLIKTAVPSWDNDSRRPGRGFTLEKTSPTSYRKWLTRLFDNSKVKPIHGIPFVAINAWNEWAEAAYLEPDVHYGAAFLNATARAVADVFGDGVGPSLYPKSAVADLTVVMPCFNHKRHLEKRINSVLMQTVRPKKIIFIDDCSTDGSYEFAEKLFADSDINVELYRNETNSGSVFRQWLNGLERVDTELVWIAETDDYAKVDFLEKLLPFFADEQILGAFSRIICVDDTGSEIQDLANYFDGLDNLSWDSPSVVPAAKLFSGDFVEKNVIPNASGFVFRRPILNEREKQRLIQYRFAGDWYFYSLILRGGSLAYVPEAISFFRRSAGGASRSVFFTDLHVREHQMVLSDINDNYSLSRESLLRHVECLAKYVSVEQVETIRSMSFADCEARPLRICIAANGFYVGGGEIVPVELASALKELGCHVTYLVMEAVVDGIVSVRNRLRSDIAVVYWFDVRSDFNGFLAGYGIDVINSHNVSFDYAAYCSGLEITIPYVASLHGGYETVRHLLDGDFSRYLGRTVTKWMYLAEKNVDVLLASGISPMGFVKVFNALPVQYTSVQRGGVRRQLGIPEGAFVLVQCSRAIREKGWEISIDATRLARELVGIDVHLVFMGSGPLLEEITGKYSNLDWVHFMGHVDSPRRFISDFDMAIFPSRFAGETFPLFLLESIACGLPCVATDIGEISLMLASGSDYAAGLVVPADIGDRQLVLAMTDSIVSVLTDSAFYRDLKDGARRQSDVFSMERLLRIYLSTFNSVRRPNDQ